MTAKYEPGQVAICTLDEQLFLRLADNGERTDSGKPMVWCAADGVRVAIDDDDLRPVVMLDPCDDDGDRHRLAAALMSWWDTNRSDFGMAPSAGHTAAVALQAAGHMLSYLAYSPPVAEQAAPTEARAEWTASLSKGPFFVYEPPRTSIDVLDAILAELRRIGEHLDRRSRAAKGTSPSRVPGRPMGATEVTH